MTNTDNVVIKLLIRFIKGIWKSLEKQTKKEKLKILLLELNG